MSKKDEIEDEDEEPLTMPVDGEEKMSSLISDIAHAVVSNNVLWGDKLRATLQSILYTLPRLWYSRHNIETICSGMNQIKLSPNSMDENLDVMVKFGILEKKEEDGKEKFKLSEVGIKSIESNGIMMGMMCKNGVVSFEGVYHANNPMQKIKDEMKGEEGKEEKKVDFDFFK